MVSFAMIVLRTAPGSFTASFDSEDELRNEHRTNLAFGALRLPTAESVAQDAILTVTLRGPAGGETSVRGRVVAMLPDGIALAIEGDADEILQRLLAKPVESQNAWDRIRGLSQMEKILLAVKAERSERAMLIRTTTRACCSRSFAIRG